MMKPTLELLNKLKNVQTKDWHKFGVEYKSIQTNSSGQVLGGQLADKRRFTFNHLTNSFQFIK